MNKKQKITQIKSATLIGMGRGSDYRPVLIYDGEPVEIGAKVTAELENGVTYTGVVTDVTTADDNHMIEFAGGISPVTK